MSSPTAVNESGWTRTVEWLERHQIPMYVLALVVGGVIGLAAPDWAPTMERAINPTLALLLFATFLGVPFAKIASSVKDVRFVGGAVALNFLIVPVVVFGLTRFIASDQALLIGALLTLLCPCVDYVMVFTKIAGGSSERLLAVAPLLMILQMLLLPLYLFVFVGSELSDIIEIDLLPLALALPASYAIAAVAVVTQTLVELAGMVIYVRLIPRLTLDHASATPLRVSNN